MKKYQKMSKTMKILSNSLTIIGVLGLLLLILSYFIRDNFNVIVFTQILSCISMATLFTISFFLNIQKKHMSIATVLIFLGSGGLLFSYLHELFSDNIMNKPITYNIASVLLSLGVITYINTKLVNNENIQ